MAHNQGIRRLTPESFKALQDMEKVFGTHSIESRRWSVVEAAVTLCADNLWLLTEFHKLPIDRHTDIPSGTLKRFHNETVEFILSGKRQIRLQTFTGMINAMCDDFVRFVDYGTRDAISARLRRPAPSLRVSSETSVRDSALSDELLSYAHHQILHRWLTNKNGLDDMVYTLSALARTHNVYNC